MHDMLDAFVRVVGTFWTSPGQPTGWKILNRIYTVFVILVVVFAAYVIFT